jgi:TPR repeat protein
MEIHYPCCGKNICKGCAYSFRKCRNEEKCPFCNSDRASKTDEELVDEVMKRVEANDAASICMLAGYYYQGIAGVQQDHTKAMELYVRAADLGNKNAHHNLAGVYHGKGNLKKARFHLEAAAMLGDEVARNNLGDLEAESRNLERAFKHWKMAASAGHYDAMHHLILGFEKGAVSRELIDSTLAAFNKSCAEFSSEARDACIQARLETD